jgi:cell division protein ZapA
MSQVTLTIGSRSYLVNCADGEEDHITNLAAMIDEKYQQLGNARAPQEAQNMLFAALFLADELTDARKTAAKSSQTVEHEKAKSGDHKAGLEAEIDTLRKAEARAREETQALKAELTEMREASKHQHDMFGSAVDAEAIAAKLEALAERAEQTAAAIEGTA